MREGKHITTYTIDAESTRWAVLNAYNAGGHIEDTDEFDLCDLHCPNCDLWIGELDYGYGHGMDGGADVRRVSVDHNIEECVSVVSAIPVSGAGGD